MMKLSGHTQETCFEWVCGRTAKVYDNCTKPVTTHEEGKPWCTIHAPSYVRAKAAAREAKYIAERDAREARDAEAILRSHQADLYPELVAALKSLNTAAIEFGVYRDLVGGCIGEQVQTVLAKAEKLKED